MRPSSERFCSQTAEGLIYSTFRGCNQGALWPWLLGYPRNPHFAVHGCVVPSPDLLNGEVEPKGSRLMARVSRPLRKQGRGGRSLTEIFRTLVLK